MSTRIESTSPLPDTFEIVRPCIVAFASRIVTAPKAPQFPQIIGTGFFIDRRGIVATNNHVINALKTLRHPQTGESVAVAIIFTAIKKSAERHTLYTLQADIRSYTSTTALQSRGPYYGEQVPDFGFVTLNIQNVPVLPLAEQRYLLRPGLEVATAGFPLGDTALLTYGKVGQLTPFLRSGIVSSVMPFDSPFPHGFTIDVMSQGGASGSPIFLKEKAVAIGILHSGYPGTNITFAVPSNMVAEGFRQSSLKPELLDMTGVPTLEEQIARADQRRGLPPFESELLP